VDAIQIADLITAGMRGPTGPEDAAFHTGVIQSWDESSGLNSVAINGVVLSNLRSVQSGIGVQYQVGDVVMVVRKQTQYFILGKVAAPGGSAANQIRYAEVSTLETTASTSYTDLATSGPIATNVYIPSSRRILLIVNCGIQAFAAAPSGTLDIGGSATINITGDSTLNVVGTVETTWRVGTANQGGGRTQVTRTWVMTAGNGINQGNHTFSMQYISKQSTVACGFFSRNFTVIPF